MKIFKIEAQGDVVYVQAADKAAANARLTEMMGTIPLWLLTFTEVDALPKGEEFL
jgi:hypothetical protein